MLIVCSGPDTWHARKKKRELVEAFKAKFDKGGFSVEESESDIKSIANQLGMPSFFSSKRLLLVEGIFEKAPIAEVRLLAKRLVLDADQTILLDLEQEPPTAKVLGEFKECVFHHYDFPLLSPIDFKKWVTQRALELGLESKYASVIAEATSGDVWSAEQELMKLSADAKAGITTGSEEQSVFSALERYLEDKRGWREELQQHAPEQALNTLVSQTRSAVRVKNRATQGLHPFQVRKISGLKEKNWEEKLQKSLRAFYSSRSGIATTSEFDTLI